MTIEEEISQRDNPLTKEIQRKTEYIQSLQSEYKRLWDLLNALYWNDKDIEEISISFKQKKWFNWCSYYKTHKLTTDEAEEVWKNTYQTTIEHLDSTRYSLYEATRELSELYGKYDEKYEQMYNERHKL